MIKVEIVFTSGKISLHKISVEEKHRGKGHASRTITSLENLARTLECDLVIKNVLSRKIHALCKKRGYCKRRSDLGTDYIYKVGEVVQPAVLLHARRK